MHPQLGRKSQRRVFSSSTSRAPPLRGNSWQTTLCSPIKASLTEQLITPPLSLSLSLVLLFLSRDEDGDAALGRAGFDEGSSGVQRLRRGRRFRVGGALRRGGSRRRAPSRAVDGLLLLCGPADEPGLRLQEPRRRGRREAHQHEKDGSSRCPLRRPPRDGHHVRK